MEKDTYEVYATLTVRVAVNAENYKDATEKAIQKIRDYMPDEIQIDDFIEENTVRM